MKVPAHLRPRRRDLPGIAAATIQAYIDDFPTWARALLRVPGYLCAAIVLLPWLMAGSVVSAVATVRGQVGGAIVIPDSRSARWITALAVGSLVGLVVMLTLAVFVALAAILLIRLPADLFAWLATGVVGLVLSPLLAVAIGSWPRRKLTVPAADGPITVPPDAIVPTWLAAWPRNVGNATLLIQQLTDLADQQGVAVLLHARSKNVAKFYLRFGFVGTGKRCLEMVRLPSAAAAHLQ